MIRSWRGRGHFCPSVSALITLLVHIGVDGHRGIVLKCYQTKDNNFQVNQHPSMFQSQSFLTIIHYSNYSPPKEHTHSFSRPVSTASRAASQTLRYHVLGTHPAIQLSAADAAKGALFTSMQGALAHTDPSRIWMKQLSQPQMTPIDDGLLMAERFPRDLLKNRCNLT